MEELDLSEFECLNCGACCRQKGYVRLKPEEPDIIAAYLKMDVYNFIEQYTQLTKDRQTLSLIEKKHTSECIFLTPDGCAIHPVKPSQCKDFPQKWKFTAFHSICEWAKRKYQKKYPG